MIFEGTFGFEFENLKLEEGNSTELTVSLEPGQEELV